MQYDVKHKLTKSDELMHTEFDQSLEFPKPENMGLTFMPSFDNTEAAKIPCINQQHNIIVCQLN